jgi:hypothetical protein
MVNAALSPSRPPASADAGGVNAPLFRRLLELQSSDRRAVILDLGPARTETVALFSQFRCRLEFTDLGEHCEQLNAETDPALLLQRVESVLPRRRREAADIVLCWDLLNYLQRPALKTLMAQVAVRSRPGTLVHALIAYSAPRMPAKPDRYAALPDGQLIIRHTTGAECAAPRYTPEDLRHCLPDYTVESAMLLKNGMQEFLFRSMRQTEI